MFRILKQKRICLTKFTFRIKGNNNLKYLIMGKTLDQVKSEIDNMQNNPNYVFTFDGDIDNPTMHQALKYLHEQKKGIKGISITNNQELRVVPLDLNLFEDLESLEIRNTSVNSFDINEVLGKLRKLKKLVFKENESLEPEKWIELYTYTKVKDLETVELDQKYVERYEKYLNRDRNLSEFTVSQATESEDILKFEDVMKDVNEQLNNNSKEIILEGNITDTILNEVIRMLCNRVKPIENYTSIETITIKDNNLMTKLPDSILLLESELISLNLKNLPELKDLSPIPKEFKIGDKEIKSKMANTNIHVENCPKVDQNNTATTKQLKI